MKFDKWLWSAKICGVVLWLGCIVVAYLPDQARDRLLQGSSERRAEVDVGPQTPATGSVAPEPAVTASIGAQGMAMLAKMVCSRGPDPQSPQRGSGGLPDEDDESTALVSEPPAVEAPPRPPRARAKRR